MSGDTNRFGEPIKKSTRKEIADELSDWDYKCLLSLCTELIYCHHANDWENLANKIKKDYENEIRNS